MNATFRNALISVSDKTGLVDFLRPLVAKGLRLLSTGGTAKHLRDHGFQVIDVSEQTGFPEVMDGRVKTLHPRIHMALLSRVGNVEDDALLKKEKLEPIDLLIVNLYPFEQQLGKNLPQEELIEFIDIGGPSLLRGAAKNFSRLSVVCDPQDYAEVLERGPGDLAWRQHLASKVFAHTSSYDAMIAANLGLGLNGPDWSLGGGFVQGLRYGENPHQQAAWFRRRGALNGLHQAQVLQGKELSYNNLLDLDAAITTVADFHLPAAVAVKHNNPCGVAAGFDGATSILKRALEADPVSVFGGIVATNFTITAAMAELLGKIFLECVVAPDFEPEALLAMAAKKNLRLLKWPRLAEGCDTLKVRSVLGGFLVQSQDRLPTEWNSEWAILGEKPSRSVQSDLLLAWKVAARLKSNAIAVAGGGRTLGLGMGQVNRVDAVAQALSRWQQFHVSEKQAVLASDAFFPFADSIEKIAASGIRYVIQPGGSMRDDEVKAAAQKHGITMVLTGERHFSH
ncbi:MAG: bifunctional phosphoribosylaminoimidazolecarboxamide formyltransferase/IMP cyclohydrolase [Bdellovibrionales bacterium]